MLVEFEDGTMGNFETNWAAAGHENELSFEVSGERGAIKFSWRHANELLVQLTDDPENLNGFRTVIIGPMHPEAESFGPVPGAWHGLYRCLLYRNSRDSCLHIPHQSRRSQTSLTV